MTAHFSSKLKNILAVPSAKHTRYRFILYVCCASNCLTRSLVKHNARPTSSSVLHRAPSTNCKAHQLAHTLNLNRFGCLSTDNHKWCLHIIHGHGTRRNCSRQSPHVVGATHSGGGQSKPAFLNAPLIAVRKCVPWYPAGISPNLVESFTVHVCGPTCFFVMPETKQKQHNIAIKTDKGYK